MSPKIEITKDNLDFYLNALAKEYRKISGKKTKAEIVLVGGASIITNYGHRISTYDIDAIISAESSIISQEYSI